MFIHWSGFRFSDTDIDCKDIEDNGVHQIQPIGFPEPVTVLCDKGWTVFLHRFNGTMYV